MENKTKEIDVYMEKSEIELISNITYSQPSIFGYSNFPIKMDILKPMDDKKYPTVVFVPGGGFFSSNKDKFIQQRLAIAESGYVVASIEYRVAPRSIFPAPLEDVKSAIRFLRANSEKYNIDKNKIAVMGNSAGGYLAAFTGVTNGVSKFDKGDNLNQSSIVQAAIDIYGLSDLNQIANGYPEEIQKLHESEGSPEALWVNGPSLNGDHNDDVGEKFSEANPITYIDKDLPPFLLMHGDEDKLVSPDQTKILHEALIKAGANSTRYVVKGGQHGGIHWVQPKVVKIIIEFLDGVLKK